MSIFYSVIFFVVAFVLDFKVFKQCAVKERVLYLSAACLSLTAIILFSLGVPIPSPSMLIIGILHKLSII